MAPDLRFVPHPAQRHAPELPAQGPGDALAEAGLAHPPLPARGELAAPFDDQRVLEELHLDVVLVDTGEVHDDLDRGRRLVRVRIGPPAGLHQQAQAIARPDVAEGPRRTGAHDHRIAVTHASISHRPLLRHIVRTEGRRGQSD